MYKIGKQQKKKKIVILSYIMNDHIMGISRLKKTEK